MAEKALYPYPYKGKPRFLLEGLLRDEGSESTTSTNIQVMTRNAELSSFHINPFPIHAVSQTPTKLTSSPSPLSSPSSFCSSVVDKMPSTDVEIATQKVLKQCQYLICYLCYEALFSRKTMNKKSFMNAMYENYHGVDGKPHVIPHAYYFTKGYGKYKSITESSDEDRYQRLTDELTQENEYKFIVNEINIPEENKVITLAMLKRKSINSKDVFSERSITSYAETAMRNCKNAYALGKQFIQADGSLPSGWSRKDFFDKVLDLMYEKTSNEPKGKKVSDGGDRAEILAKERPKRWVFNGYMAFVLFGPFAVDDIHKSNLMSGSKYVVLVASSFCLICI